ncbi:MAG: hypothetical protein ACRDAM_05650 [Casimicrobium sp.]
MATASIAIATEYTVPFKLDQARNLRAPNWVNGKAIFKPFAKKDLVEATANGTDILDTHLLRVEGLALLVNDVDLAADPKAAADFVRMDLFASKAVNDALVNGLNSYKAGN